MVCGQYTVIDAFVDHPVVAFSWAAESTNPAQRDDHRRTGRASMGGLALLKELRLTTPQSA